MSIAANQVLRKNPQTGRLEVGPRPEWANDPKNMLSVEDVEKFNEASLAIPPRMEYRGRNFFADIVTRGESDLIYHFQTETPEFPDILAEVVDVHFGGTDRHRLDAPPELMDPKRPRLRYYGLLGKGVRLGPMFNRDHHTSTFLELLDDSIDELHKG